jgi:hypothetical protein
VEALPQPNKRTVLKNQVHAATYGSPRRARLDPDATKTPKLKEIGALLGLLRPLDREAQTPFPGLEHLRDDPHSFGERLP